MPCRRLHGGAALQREARGRAVDVENAIVGLLVERLRQRIVAAIFRGKGCKCRALVSLDDRLGGIFRVTAELP
jgi:hypothetical protein